MPTRPLLAIGVVLALGALGCGDDRPASPPPGARTDVGDPCVASCAAAAGCRIAPTTCVEDCRQRPDLARCFALARTSCREAARCGFQATCDAVPAGAGSCGAAMACQLGCPAGDLACGCRCVPALAPVHTLTLLQLDVCAINCAYAPACMRLRCAPIGQLCAGM